MSLLDDVSIAVTPNGYKAGELYAVVPVPTEGSEEVTNGDFATDSDWTKQSGWSISGGSANYDGVGSVYLQQGGVFTANTQHKITFTVSNNTSGQFSIRDGLAATFISNTYYANGTYTFYITSNANTSIRFYGVGGTGSLSLDNVSVKEYTAADLDVTRATAATRVDENGLVNYAEIVGSEEVTNGDFATDSDWTKGGLATISSGEANFIDAGSNTYSYIRQNISQTSGKNYLLEFEVKNYVSGAVQVLLEGVSSVGSYNSNGIYSVVILSGTTNGYVELSRSYSGGTFSFSIDNVSVKEVTRDNVPRIDYTGGEDILGSEVVTNGDFATDTDWIKGGGTIISGGQANIDGDGSSFASITQSNVFTSGKIYKVTSDVIITSGLGLKFQDGANNENIGFATTTGSYSFYFTATSNTSLVIGRRTGGTAFDSSVDNISVKEITGQTAAASCPHILAEPQRTNLVTESSDLSSAAWNKDAITVTSDNINSLDGTQNADLLLETTNNSRHIFWDNASVSGGDYTVSIFLKKQNNRYVFFQSGVDNAGTRYGIIYDFDGQVVTDTDSLGSPTNASYKVEQHINGWVRLSITQTHTSGSVYLICGGSDAAIPTYNSNAEPEYAGNTSNGYYVWGGQLEQGSYATSYIPTSGSTVTRNQDQFTRDGISSLINSTEGVLFVQMLALTDDGTPRSISLNSGASSNRVAIQFRAASGQINTAIVVGGAAQSVMPFTISQTAAYIKIALKWKVNDFALWVNGVEVGTDASGSTFTSATLNSLDFNDGGGTEGFYGKVKQLQVYKTALTDSQLTSLTS